ncbi:unnamed protein product [Acanthoscelides obtectus]|uniref:Uncharacterized protein n=1 Tax=Acanthoscelides obtectus TaxID=200917 RepID=A0A9P0LZA0_ACAOB|nr:unnamed protein product [Acanthoscelides obtectus]
MHFCQSNDKGVTEEQGELTRRTVIEDRIAQDRRRMNRENNMNYGCMCTLKISNI